MGVRDLKRRNVARCGHLVRGPQPLGLEELDWAAVPEHPLDPQIVNCLVYMRDVEGFTDRDLVGLAGHPTTLADPLVRRFLDTWRAEESAHADALDRFLHHYGVGTGTPIPARQPPPPATLTRFERTMVQVTRPVGHVVTAAHMVWGAANELLTLNGYRRLVARCHHPVLADLLSRISAQEARHYSFYLLQAEWRLADSRLARAVVRHLLRETWTPVGVGDGYKSQEEFDRLVAYLGSGADGRRIVERMDHRFAQLPGLGDLRIFQRVADPVFA